MSKYKPSINDFESVGGIEKLERDGFTRSDTWGHLYKCTKGMDTDSRRELVDRFYNRNVTKAGYPGAKKPFREF
jgi:hypothetical protein